MISTHAARAVVHSQNELGESPRWNATSDELAWVDITAGTVWCWSAATDQVDSFEVGPPLGSLETLEDGRFLACVGTRVLALSPIGPPVCVGEHRQEGVRLNDSGVDPTGRLWTSTMNTSDPSQRCELFQLSALGGLAPSGIEVGAGNGIAWSPDGSAMYFTDSANCIVSRSKYDSSSGTATHIETFLAFDEGIPDGLTCDSAGGLWVSMWGLGQVRRYKPDGTLTDIVELAAPYVTAAAFGGPQLCDLYFTTARQGLSDPHSGDIFSVRTPHRGLPRPTVRLETIR